METKSLPLPTAGVVDAHYIDGMREIVAYDVSCDGFHARWDTFIRNKKQTVQLCSFACEKKEPFLERCRPLVLAFFRSLESEKENG
jgi:hypothetical protein